MSVGGSYYDMEGEANIDNSVNTSTSKMLRLLLSVSADTTIDYQGQGLTLG